MCLEISFFMISTWFFWVRFSSMVKTRNLTKFVVLISMLLNIMVGSYHGTKTPFHFMKHNILSFFAFHESLCQAQVTHKYLFTINYLEKCFCVFIRIKKVLSLAKSIESKYFFTL